MLDTKQEIKQLLKDYSDISGKLFDLNQKLSEIARYKDLYPDTVKAAAPREDNIQRTTVSDPVFDLITRYDDEIEGYTAKINALLDKKKLVEQLLYIIEPIERRVIILRYIDNPSYRCDIWAWIGAQVNYSRPRVVQLHAQALDKMVAWYK